MIGDTEGGRVFQAEGITAKALAKQLKAELKAKIQKAKYDAKTGKWKYSQKMIAWDVRQRARMDAQKILGMYPADKFELSVPEALVNRIIEARKRANGDGPTTES